MSNENAYLDAKFEGLANLMKNENENLRGYIKAVSENNKEFKHDCDEKVAKVLDSLQAHEKDIEAHGANVTNRHGGNLVAWAGLLVALLTAVAIAAPLFHKGG